MSEERDTKFVFKEDFPSVAKLASEIVSAPILLQYSSGVPCKRFEITRPVTTIGRRPESVDIWIDDISISREHCRLERIGEEIFVTDLGSRNFTLINGHKVDGRQRLFHGDTLQLGNVRLRYYAHGTSDQLLFDSVYLMAVQDQMLGIFRKEYLMQKLEEEFLLARYRGHDLSLIFVDLDRFKNINDIYGHPAGDHVLREVCQVVKSVLRQGDTFGRYGGEEFCLILPGMGSQEACEFAERIRRTLEETVVMWSQQRIPVTASLGVAWMIEETQGWDSLLQLADMMVYQSKQLGRNRVSAPVLLSP
ncbi:MAG: GGDEF domain-containing protein [Cyanobacteriota bacterium]|nr:GGDEF domain-containing protein [Cyanobacteriota bacterium]